MYKNRFLILTFLVASLNANAIVLTLAPPAGWQVESQKVYSRETLYRYIDGGAELFLEFGFKELRVVRLKQGKARLSVEMYRMAEPLSALGIYLAKCAPEIPMRGVTARNSGDRYQLAMARGGWFILINNADGDKSRVPLMRQLANKLARQLPEKKVEWPCPLPGKGLVKGSIRLARGPLALRPVCALGKGDFLRLNRRYWAIIADYLIRGKTETQIRVNYENEKNSRNTFGFLLKNLASYLKVIRKNSTCLVFRDNAGEYGITRIHGPCLDIRVHLPSEPEK